MSLLFLCLLELCPQNQVLPGLVHPSRAELHLYLLVAKLHLLGAGISRGLRMVI